MDAGGKWETMNQQKQVANHIASAVNACSVACDQKRDRKCVASFSK